MSGYDRRAQFADSEISQSAAELAQPLHTGGLHSPHPSVPPRVQLLLLHRQSLRSQ